MEVLVAIARPIATIPSAGMRLYLKAWFFLFLFVSNPKSSFWMVLRPMALAMSRALSSFSPMPSRITSLQMSFVSKAYERD